MKDPELSNVEMTNFIVVTVATLFTCAFAIICTYTAQQHGHDDRDGLAYHLATLAALLVYTFGNVVLMINGIS